jgi:inhibitor of cysteine peptidase
MMIDYAGGCMINTLLSGKIMLFIAFLAVAMACSCSVKPAVTVTDADNGTTVEVNNGDILAVQLAAQLGTGFGWKVVTTDKKLELKGDPEQISKGDQKPGAPAYQSFKFKAVEKGETEVKLQYVEGWKKDTKPLKEFTVTVDIK